jgi:hypothetical protein
MGRKGKEPAGLRRWRLAHKKKKTRSRPTKKYRKVRSYMTRRKGRRGFGRKSKAIPMLAIAPVIYQSVASYRQVGGDLTLVPENLFWRFTGYSMKDGGFNKNVAAASAGMFLAAFVAHKVANRFGINKHVKKLTGGYLVL